MEPACIGAKGSCSGKHELAATIGNKGGEGDLLGEEKGVKRSHRKEADPGVRVQ